MTDGEETCDEASLPLQADEVWKNGIKVYAIGFAFGSPPSSNMRRMGIYKDANDGSQLTSVFQEIKTSLEKDTSAYDEKKQAAADDIPSPSYVGRMGHFRSSGPKNAGKLYRTLARNSSYEYHFNEQNRFTVLEHGYHVTFDEQLFDVQKVEVLKVRLEEQVGFIYGGIVGFVYLDDVTIE